MKQFIKTHPWRLEIVPALAFLISIGAILFYHIQLAQQWNASSMSNITNKSPYIFFLWQIIMLLCLWLFEIRINHQWVFGETEKKFNYMAILLHMTMILKTIIAFSFVFFIYSFVNNANQFQIPWLWDIVVLATGLSFTALLEKTRKPISIVDKHEPSPPVGINHTGEPFLYNDTEVDWFMAIYAVLLGILSLLYIAAMHKYDMALIGIPGSILLGSLAYRRVTVNPEGIMLSCGPIRKRFEISDIVNCRSIRHRMWNGLGNRRPRAICVTSGRCLEVTTQDGKTHIFGMLRPSYACSLLEPLIDHDA